MKYPILIPYNFYLLTKVDLISGDTENGRKISAKLNNIKNIETERRQIEDLHKICSSFKNMEFANCVHQINVATESSLNYEVMKVECLIRLFKLSEAENIMKSLKHPHMQFLKGLLCYYEDKHAEAVGHFKNYKNQYKDEEVQKFLIISNKILEIKKEWGFSKNLNMLKKINQEIQKSKYSELHKSETLMRLYYQRALINIELKNSDDAFADCEQALHIDPDYENALNLRKTIFEKANSYQTYYGI